MYRLGEYISNQICDFSDGDFSKVGNAVRKGAVIGAMGLTALAPAKAMSIEDQIKADTRAYTTTEALAGYSTPVMDKEYAKKYFPSEMKGGLIKDSGEVNIPAVGYELSKMLKDPSTFVIESELKKAYSDKNISDNADRLAMWGKAQRDLEQNLDKKTKESELAGKVYKQNNKSVGGYLKDAWDSTSKSAGKAWDWMKGVGSKIADKISGSKNKDKEFSEGDFGIKNLKGNLAKVLTAGTIGLTALGGGALGHWAANHPMFASDHQRPSISAMKKAADSYENQARNYQLLALSPDTDSKSAQDNLDKSTHYFERANALHEEADRATRNATKIPRALGATLGGLSGAFGGAAAIGAAKQKQKENELIEKYMKNSSSAGTP